MTSLPVWVQCLVDMRFAFSKEMRYSWGIASGNKRNMPKMRAMSLRIWVYLSAFYLTLKYISEVSVVNTDTGCNVPSGK